MSRPSSVTNVIKFKPRTFTSAEAVIDALRSELFASGRSWSDIAKQANCSPSTVQRLASGKTKWPARTTLFPLLASLDLEFTFQRKIRRAPDARNS